MDRRTFLCGLTLGALSGSVVSQAQQPARVHRIGVLRSLPPNDPSMAAFRQALLDLGYFEGKDFLIEYRSAEGQPEGFADLAVELQRLKADVLVVEGTPLSLAAKQAIGSTPIVFAAVADAVGSGLVVSLARPGGNITGLSFLGPDTVGKHLQLLKEAVPRITRVAILSHPGNPSEATRRAMLKEAEVAARGLVMRPQFLEAQGPNDFDGAFAKMTRAHADAVTVLTSIMFYRERKRLIDIAAKYRIPAVYPWREPVDAGGLMSYGPNIPDLFRRAAYFVDRILKGSRAGDLPVEQPTKFDMVINLKTAKALWLTIPQTLLLQATQVIE
jgi:ABC-type uncharacterized transport system substrate-binding protein